VKAIVCNKCGTVITSEDIIGKTTRLDFATKLGKYQEMHLCEKCLKLFREFMNS